MREIRPIVARTPAELARVLELSAVEAKKWQRALLKVTTTKPITKPPKRAK
jgi:hypothetical protein